MFYCMLDVLCYVCIVHILWSIWFINKIKILVAGQKHKHVHKTIREKGQALQGTKKGLSNKRGCSKI